MNKINRENPNYTKPSGLTQEYGAQFQDAGVVKAYRHREPYPEETFEILRGLAGPSTPIVADIGCGSGDLSFGMSRFAIRIDAVDISERMINEAKRSPNARKKINWICAPAESADLDGPYDLITAADSVHWMDWKSLFPKIQKWLKPGKFFCVVGRWYANRNWWDADFQALIDTHSTNKDYTKYDIIEELEKSGLVNIVGSTKTKPMAFTQSVDDLIEAFHSRNGLSRERMASAEVFDREAKRLLSRFAVSGCLELRSSARITWMTISERAK